MTIYDYAAALGMLSVVYVGVVGLLTLAAAWVVAKW